jgi:hypothetical protein
MSEYIDYCSLCGIALTQSEITSIIEGQVVFFLERRVGTMQMTFCADCTNKIVDIMDGGLDKAISRRLDIPDQEPVFSHPVLKEKYYRRKDDEDGSGGVKIGIPPA